MFRAKPSVAALALALIVPAACAVPKMRSTLDRRPTAAEMAQLWVKPASIASRDLFWGPGGPELAPKEGVTYKVESFDETGMSGGWDLEDPEGREYSVKIGQEAQVEVVVSRLHWAVGYHQPPTYLLSRYDLSGEKADEMAVTGRFRPKLEDLDNVGDWSWHENPFVGTREFKGLVVLQLILNNWDIKTQQNKIYEVKRKGEPNRWYVVRDLGAAFGKTAWPVGTKNNPEDYEKQQLIKRVLDNRGVEFDYDARHKELFEDVTADDVVWICELLNQITPKQYADAFRAAAYPQPLADRFIAKLRSKVQEGLKLRSSPR
ncbi:MAG: hypothetical protein WD690_13880 [Vicinamibacterales bacterium]